MNFTNLSNTFTIFGNFAVFDEDNIGIINKLFSDCKITINNENNPNNKSGRYMQITDTNKHMTIFLRPNRIDVQLPGTVQENKKKLINDANDIYKAFYQMFEGSMASRIAVVASSFVFDDNNEALKELADRINLINGNMAEISLRINYLDNVLDENINMVLNINNIMIGASNTPNERRRAIMATFDINTANNFNDERFNLHELEPYFTKFYDIYLQKLKELSNI